MCVVKVNRVESNVLGISNKDSTHDSSPAPSPSSLAHNLKVETDTHTDGHHLSGSGVTSRAPEGLGQWPEASQMHPGTNESKVCCPEKQDLSTTQDCSIQDLPLEDNQLHSSSHTTSASAESEMSSCLPDTEPPTLSSACNVDAFIQTPNSDSNMDTATDNDTKSTTEREKMDAGFDPKHINLHSTSEALYSPKTEPVEGDSYTSRCSLSPSGDNYSSEKRSTEENLFPPLLQRNAVDMPLLTPEQEDKVGICPLPPVLTQEMPSLTPAHEGITDVSGSTSCNDQVAPVLQREKPTNSPSSQRAKQEGREMDSVMSKEPLAEQHYNSWPLALPYNCEMAAVSGTEGTTDCLSASVSQKITSDGVHEMLVMAETTAENDCTELKNVTSGQSHTSAGQLVQSTALQPEQEKSPAGLASKTHLEHLASSDCVLSPSSAHSLSTGTSKNISSPSSTSPPPLCTQSHTDSAVQLHHNTTYLHCTAHNPYTEPKPLSSSIWKNLNSHSSAVLIQSLNPELPTDFTHDPLPYTMWTEPQCKEVTDLESSEMELRESENQEEEGGPLTWAQLEPTSLISVGAVEPLGLCGDYEAQSGEGEGSEGLSLCRELGRPREAKGIPHSDTVVSPLLMGGGEQDGGSDMEEGVSDGEEAERQSSARGDNSSDSSDEEEEEEDEEENDASNYQCYESGLEPGEICAVSASKSHTFSLLLIFYVYMKSILFAHSSLFNTVPFCQ